MVPHFVGEVVRDLEQVLVEPIGLTKPVDAHGRCQVAAQANLCFRKSRVLHVPLVPEARVHKASLVVRIVAKRAVQLRRKRVLLASKDILAVFKAEAGLAAANALIVPCIHVIVPQRQTVAIIDVPVELHEKLLVVLALRERIDAARIVIVGGLGDIADVR